jgi:hypothetical protein
VNLESYIRVTAKTYTKQNIQLQEKELKSSA